MPSQLEARLRAPLRKHDGKSELLFVNRRGRPFSANKLREKQLHPLLVKLGIPRGGFHSMRHGAASATLADGATPAVVQRQLRHSNARITLGLYGHGVGDQQVTWLKTVRAGLNSSRFSRRSSVSRRQVAMSDWMQRDLKNYDATGRQLHPWGIGLMCFGTGVQFARAFAPSALMPFLTLLLGLALSHTFGPLILAR